MGPVVWRFLIDKIRHVRFLAYFGFIGTFIGMVAGLEALYAKYLLGNHGYEALAWSILTAASISVIGALILSCALAQIKVNDELERVIRARNQLERELLKKRKSSKGKRR